MKAPKLFLSLILGTTLLTGVCAFDWGGTIDNSTMVSYTFTDPGALLLQKDKFAFWLVNQFTPTSILTAQASFTYIYENPRPDYPYLPDMDLLNLQGGFSIATKRPSVLRYTVGRWVLRDFSDLVLSDGLDGLKLDWITWLANTTLAVGYTGLHFDQTSDVNVSWADINNTELLAPPRLIGLLSAEFPSLFLGQDLSAAFVMQQDFRPEDEVLAVGPSAEVVGQGGRLSTQYLGFGLDGNLTRSLYYSFFAYLGTGKSLSYISGEYQYSWVLATLLGTSLQYFNEELLFSRAEFRLLFSSGDADFSYSVVEGNREGLATVFVPISSKDLALVFSPRLSNLILMEASYSIKPLGGLQTQLKGFVFLRPAAGPVSDLRVDGDSIYLGSEIDTVVKYRPLSDLGLALSFGLFFPGQKAFAAAERDPEFRGRFEISLAF